MWFVISLLSQEKQVGLDNEEMGKRIPYGGNCISKKCAQYFYGKEQVAHLVKEKGIWKEWVEYKFRGGCWSHW